MIKHTISYLIANVLSFIKPATIKNSILIISQTIEKLYRTLILLNEKAINSQVSMCFFQNFPKYKRITSIRTLYKLGPLHPPMESYHISLEHNTENESPHQIKFAPLRETHCFWQGWLRHHPTILARGGRPTDLEGSGHTATHYLGIGWLHDHPIVMGGGWSWPPHRFGRGGRTTTPCSVTGQTLFDVAECFWYCIPNWRGSSLLEGVKDLIYTMSLLKLFSISNNLNFGSSLKITTKSLRDIQK